MAEQWTHVRIKRSTLEQLERERAARQRGAEAGCTAVDFGRADAVTMDSTIRFLCEKMAEKRRRCCKSKAKRRAAQREQRELERWTVA